MLCQIACTVILLHLLPNRMYLYVYSSCTIYLHNSLKHSGKNQQCFKQNITIIILYIMGTVNCWLIYVFNFFVHNCIVYIYVIKKECNMQSMKLLTMNVCCVLVWTDLHQSETSYWASSWWWFSSSSSPMLSMSKWIDNTWPCLNSTPSTSC